jgi:hypothetical protein
MSANPNKVTTLNERLSEVFRARVRIWPTATQEILVAINDDPPRGLDDLGQGVTQIMTIVAAMLSMPIDPVLLLEEPEICLHPGLQRQLIDHLALQTGQVFITTHSNHLIDTSIDRARLHLITYNSATGSRAVVPMANSFLQAAHELGVVASSIAVAGAVLWVEGPSDAIYLQHWLLRHSRGARLRAGRDFTFAFHGGALLAHVGLDNEAVKLFALHPGFYLVADSDRLKAGADTVHPYLQRLVVDDRLRDRLWVTTPKEVEGYLPDTALTDEAPTGVQTTGYEPLDQRLAFLGLPRSRCEHKVILAQHAVKKLASMPVDEVFAPHDLSTRVEHLVVFIEGCRRTLPAIVS